MEYIYAALLLDAAGKEVNEKDLMEVVKSAGFKPDEAKAKAVVESLKGLNIKDIIKNAQSVQAAPAQAAAAPAHEQKAAKKEEKAEAKSEDEAAGGLAGLFG
ncbi:MAG: 50S ribosomal protein P1 [Candidatus Marsarchaeota archaeon]|nr:50S ribosomal protein P1 [Candidatus Marsarchaeota archaeon]